VKRILLLIKGLGRGGAEELLATAARHVDRDRFDYRVAYLLPWKNALVKEIEDSGTEVHCLDGGRGTAWLGRLRELVEGQGIDLVHSHSPVAAVGSRMALTGRWAVRRVYTEHNVWERYHVATRYANMLTIARCDHAFAVSDHVRDSMRYAAWLRWRSMPPVETLFHGIDHDETRRWATADDARAELGIAPGALLIGTVANLKQHKRLDVLIDAAVIVHRRLPEARFVIVGQGPLERELRTRVRANGLDHVVLFTGFREDAQRIASAFDVFALSSDHEGLSIAVIEALALGRPAIVTAVGGLTEVVRDGVEGIVVPPRNPRAIAEAILALNEDPARRDALGAHGVERAKAFDIRHAVRRMEEVYEEMLT
jgi:glycosyltransferase involved in cell wall biosynthesis